MTNLPEPFDMLIFNLYSSGVVRSRCAKRTYKSILTIDLLIAIGKMHNRYVCSFIPIREGGENMDKDQIKSLVAGLGIASLVAGVSIAAPTHAAQSG